VPWTHLARGADGLDAAADVDADREDRALIRRLARRPADVVIDQVFETPRAALVTGGAIVAMLLEIT